MPSGQIVVVCPNPAVEITYYCDQFSSGKSNNGEQRLAAGGKGVNVARILAHLGCAPLLVTCLGGLSGEFISQHLATLPLMTEYIRHSGNTRFSTVIYGNAEKTPTVIRSAGDIVSEYIEAEFQQLITSRSPINGLMCVSGSICNGFSKTFLEVLCQQAARQHNRVIVDVAGEALMSALRGNPFLVKVNREEASEVVGEYFDIYDAKRLLDLIILRGAQNVLVTLGRDGWVGYVDGNYLKCSISPNQNGYDIGAGDAMMAGILHYLRSDYRWNDTLEYATKIAAVSSYAPSSGEIDLAKLHQSPPCSISLL